MARVSVEVPAELTGPIGETVLLLYEATAESARLAVKARTEGRGSLEDVDLHRTRLAELDDLLSALDAAILYFTLRLLGLTTAQTRELPLLPLAAFFVLLNGGYFIAFTAVGNVLWLSLPLTLLVAGFASVGMDVRQFGPLPTPGAEAVDRLLVRVAPGVFALQRSVVLRSRLRG